MTALARPLARGTRGAAATGHPLATEAALEVFAEGGNATDAAISAAYALCVLLPESCGLGGDALLTVRDAEGPLIAFNGSGKSPRSHTGSVPRDGARTATVPGLVRALEDARERCGHLPRESLLAGAIRLARDGFPAGDPLLAAISRQRERLEPTGWPPLEGRLAAGTPLRQTELAELLERIAAHGPPAFYEGEIAAAIRAVAQRADGALDELDLRVHETQIAEPLEVSFHGSRVHAQPPVSQAVLGLMALKHLDAVRPDRGPPRLHAAIEAIEAAFLHRDRVANAEIAQLLLAEPLSVDPERAGLRGGPTAQTHTTAVATADANGMVVSMVISVFDEFGCAALVPEGGFFLNNRMMGFSTSPGSPNEVGPGKRPVHTLSPMLVEGDDTAFGISTPGADGQVQTLVQVIDAIVEERLDTTAALDRRRWRSSDARLLLEEGFDPDAAEGLAEVGHRIEWRPAGDRPFGATVIAGIDRREGTVFAAADLRREAWAGAR